MHSEFGLGPGLGFFGGFMWLPALRLVRVSGTLSVKRAVGFMPTVRARLSSNHASRVVAAQQRDFHEP